MINTYIVEYIKVYYIYLNIIKKLYNVFKKLQADTNRLIII